MAWDVLNQILEFARVRKLLNEDHLLGMKPFKDSGQANDDSELSDEPDDADVMPYSADQIEAIIARPRAGNALLSRSISSPEFGAAKHSL
jgi:hypothetical protein